MDAGCIWVAGILHGHQCFLIKCKLSNDGGTGKLSTPNADGMLGCYSIDVFKRYVSLCFQDGGDNIDVAYCEYDPMSRAIKKRDKAVQLTDKAPVELKPKPKKRPEGPGALEDGDAADDAGGDGDDEDELKLELEASLNFSR